MIIGITGVVGSGKSGVTAMLAAALGCESIDTDMVCRQLLLPQQPGWVEMRKRWGTRFLGAGDQLDRVRLREAVFDDPAVREELEDILHPLVRQQVRKRIDRARVKCQHLLIEVPLLYEVGWQHDFDGVVAVYAPTPACIARTVRRDMVPRHQAASILSLQLSSEEKADKADWVIHNGGLWAATALQVSHLVRQLQRSVLH